jgi:hypothetical protein
MTPTQLSQNRNINVKSMLDGDSIEDADKFVAGLADRLNDLIDDGRVFVIENLGRATLSAQVEVVGAGNGNDVKTSSICDLRRHRSSGRRATEDNDRLARRWRRLHDRIRKTESWGSHTRQGDTGLLERKCTDCYLQSKRDNDAIGEGNVVREDSSLCDFKGCVKLVRSIFRATADEIDSVAEWSSISAPLQAVMARETKNTSLLTRLHGLLS